MGSESKIPPNLTDPKQNQDSEPVKPMAEETQAEPGDNAREASPQSVFVNSEPMREDQVQNAVKFLSHPKVRGSPVQYRRSFLEKKGLTKDEIDEAFRRVPDPAPTAMTTPAINQNQDGQVKPVTNLQQHQQQSTQTPQPPTGVVSTVTALRPARFHWSHAFLCLGFLAVSGAGTALLFKKSIIPKLKSWIRKVVREEDNESVRELDLKPSLAEEAASAAKAAAAAAADVAKASQDILNSKVEERRYFESLRNLLDVQVEEMKSMSNAIKKLEVTKEVAIPTYRQTEEPTASTNVRPLSAPASVEPSVAPHPKSYMEIMAMIQRGEKPPGIKEINDLPPNPNQPPSNPRLAPRLKPWEMSQSQNGFYQVEGSSSMAQDYHPNAQVNVDNSDNWMQRRNVRITEMEPDNEMKMPTYRPPGTEKMNQRAWVPPQPPPIAMPEAAAAIRQPKPVIQTDLPNGNQLSEHPQNGFDELQRITKISESGGEIEINEVSTVPKVTEIQEEL